MFSSGRVTYVDEAPKELTPEYWENIKKVTTKEKSIETAIESIAKHNLSRIKYFEDQGDYDNRNKLIWSLFSAFRTLGHKVGIRIDPQEPEWPVVFIELPTGQVSWHVPQHDMPWDGHTTEEKYQRIKEYCEQ